ncbi:sensor domain-containing diguanylate cyclase [Janthinobacterium sp. ROICE36]|uniref:diguanylate cyclase domain-containing protein n=1 Tax=Janthinobacterium sp. ROICE36 TaxID=2048670 RepID=UPI000C7EBE68|nr:diguanylate cyclase [Janthinobacterium sp. ROICE36]PLY40162.1 sensor domain-containing diguanylate cyclase [Janthinobacterium sp. ROICE36]
MHKIWTFFNPWSFKFKMAVLVGVLVLCATGSVALASLSVAQGQMASVIGNQQYALLTSAAAYIDDDLNAKKALLRVLAEGLPSDVYEHPQRMQAFVEKHPTLREEFFNLVAFDATGKLIASLNDRSVVGKLNVATRDYFVDTVKFREGVISRPFKSLLSGRPIVLVTEPIYDAAGELLYVIAGGINLQSPTFFGQWEQLKPGKSGYLFMLTDEGTILHHPDAAHILKRVGDEKGGAMPSTLAALRGFDGWTQGKTTPGVQAIITYKHLHAADWIVGAVYPESEAFTPITDIYAKVIIASSGVAFLASGAGWLAVMLLLRPLGDLGRHVARIRSGNADIKVFDIARKDEFGKLSRAFYALSQQREAAESNLAALARTDMLTGLHNRRMFDEALAAALTRARRAGTGLALAYLDIDYFKKINDTYGHGIGDLILIEFAQRLKACVRASDTVARLAGDEFVIIFEQLTDQSELAILGKKIVQEMVVHFDCGGISLHVATSVGLAFSAQGDTTAGALLTAADTALYKAKSAGRNGYAVTSIGSPALTESV